MWLVSNGAQSTIETGWIDKGTGYWYLHIGDEVIGYWPGEIVPNLSGGAEEVNFGGEIFDDRSTRDNTALHTTTEMGCGHFSRERWERTFLRQSIVSGQRTSRSTT
ncbi:hypothetical protein QJS10_CPB20g00484 [Acorus calamus]|uniref:Neprosin PEP catalytic domain-containing protein n=1 Tax=Acorus calamus TaxID=4465 RepID=A0AAV9C9Z8_ACOCL|nr:hypothetical protein QJS10_CPB20g00484 [Acorus calamus]